MMSKKRERLAHPCPKRVLWSLGFTTQREWKKYRRAKLRKLEKALEEYNIGCAYAPGYNDGRVKQLHRIVESIREDHKVRRWG